MYMDSSGARHGFVKIGTQYTSIDVPGYTATNASAINNAGQITVNASKSIVADAFLYNGKTFKNISPPNQTYTYASALNNKGDVDGTYLDANNTPHGWLLHGGKYYKVDDPKGGEYGTEVDGLNDKLEIVGIYCGDANCGLLALGGIGFKATTK
jgi:hypothetical protein